jgi:spermidine synthase
LLATAKQRRAHESAHADEPIEHSLALHIDTPRRILHQDARVRQNSPAAGCKRLGLLAQSPLFFRCRSAVPEPAPPPSSSNAATTPAKLAVLLALFAASGCAALIYQIVWLERLALAIGSSAASLGVVLATFMAGLGLGSLLASRLRESGSPLRRYALLELALGALGIVTLFGIPLLGGAYAALAGGGAWSLGVRLLVAGAALLPATVLMGATLPVVAACVGSGSGGAARLGWLYAANTAGGVVGAVAAAFWLLRAHDAHVATYVAAALNVGVASVAGALARRYSPAPANAAEAPANGPRASGVTAIYVAAAVSGMTALAAEVLWTRHLSLLLGGTVYTFALILAVLLLGLGLGSAAGAPAGKRVDARIALAACQALLAIAMAAGAYAMARSLPFWPIDVTAPTTAAAALQRDLLRVAIVVLPAALLWGASFPLALAAAMRAGEDPRRAVGRLYAANTAGAIVGALATTFVLVAVVGSQRAAQLMILASVAAALLLLVRYRGFESRGLQRAAGAAAAFAAAAVAVPALPPELIAYGRFLPTRGLDANVVYVGEGVTASIAVTEEPDGTLTYHNAGKTQASTYPQDMRLQRMLGHLTTLVATQPRNVLVIGLGAGITAGAVSLDPAVERVVVAELEPLVPTVAAGFFDSHNYYVVTNDKVEIRIDDGRHLLTTTAERFDAITSDPLDPWVKGAAALYTREFWQLCRERLNDGGVVTVFVQLYETTEDAVRSELATFFDVFPNAAVFANTVDGMGYDLVLVGINGDEPIDVAHLTHRLERRDYARVAASLRAVGFDTALDLLSTFTADAPSLEPWLAGAAHNTDRNLRLQYLAGDGLNVLASGEIYAALDALGPRVPPKLFTGTPAQLEELRQRVAARKGRY